MVRRRQMIPLVRRRKKSGGAFIKKNTIVAVVYFHGGRGFADAFYYHTPNRVGRGARSKYEFAAIVIFVPRGPAQAFHCIFIRIG